ncbi:MAG: methionyl-tRNA formyltransferase [Proteobacteria bacterium]|nr:methionyl-tRNA formyltransferase [Pseudomonadota bacterium]
MRIVFAGTPEFAAIQLQALLQAKFEIVAVYTQPDKPAGRGQHLHESEVKQIAKAHGLPIEQPNTLKTPQAQTTLAQYNADLMIVAAYGLLLPKAILETPRLGCINVHASLLPRWRGASPIQQAILHGDKETGVTLMQMDEGLDTGDMIATIGYTLSPQETAQSLHDKLAALGANLLVEKLPQINTLTRTKQDPQLVTHAGKIHKEDALVNWQDSAINIDRKIRAFTPWPIAYTKIDGQILRLWQAQIVNAKEKPGKIIEHTPQGIVIATGENSILITHAQLPGKKMMPTIELIKGHHDLFALGHFLG